MMSRLPAVLPWRKCGFDSRWALSVPTHFIQDVGKLGNPPVSGTGERGFKSHRPDLRLRCGQTVRQLPVKETIAGSTPAAAASTCTNYRHGTQLRNSLRVGLRTPSSRFSVARGSASGRLPVFEPGDGGSTPSPRTWRSKTCLDSYVCSGIVAAGTRYLSLKQEAVGSIPTPGTDSIVANGSDPAATNLRSVPGSLSRKQVSASRGL